MLVLSRKKNERIRINDDIELVVVEIRGDKVRLGIDAPTHVTVHRQEVYDAIQRGATVTPPSRRSSPTSSAWKRLPTACCWKGATSRRSAAGKSRSSRSREAKSSSAASRPGRTLRVSCGRSKNAGFPRDFRPATVSSPCWRRNSGGEYGQQPAITAC